jgi:IS30 family transposase
LSKFDKEAKRTAKTHRFVEVQIKEIETKINNRPRKRYGYENPIFVMENLLFNPKVAFVA